LAAALVDLADNHMLGLITNGEVEASSLQFRNPDILNPFFSDVRVFLQNISRTLNISARRGRGCGA
jgi:hypothetical protein